MSVRRVPGRAPWVHMRVWVVEVRSCHDAIVGPAVGITVVIAVVGFVTE